MCGKDDYNNSHMHCSDIYYRGVYMVGYEMALLPVLIIVGCLVLVNAIVDILLDR